MREHSPRAHPANVERGEHRPGGGSKSKSGGTRSRRGTNLARLGKALGLDLLGAALGLSGEAVSILVDGRDHAREEQYAAHLAARFKDAGIPATWLDNEDAKVTPEYLSALRKFAAASSNKAPIRRANFRRIATAFVNREEVLADALEMIPSAVMNVAEGLLEFDDGRIGHINPRLMRAGFPDGWLEQAEPDLTDAMLLSLEQLATDGYERAFEEESSVAHAGQAFVSPTLAQAHKTTPQPAAAPVEPIKEATMSPQRQPKAPEPTPPKPEFAAAGMPNAKPMAHPSAGAPRLPRSVMAAGRKVTGGPAAKPLPTNATKQGAKAGTPPPQMQSMPQMPSAPSAAPVQTKASSPAPAANTAPAGTPAAPEARRTLAPRGTVSKEVSLARAKALEQLLDKSRRGAKVTLWRDLLGSSLPFWGNIRRGAVLFRDDLAEGVVEAMGLPEGWLDNPSFPPPSMSAWVTDKNAPVPAPVRKFGDSADDGSQSADQGSDANAGAGNEAPAPAAAAPAAQAPAPAAKTSGGARKRDATKPFARSTAPQPPRVTMSQQPPSAPPVFPGTGAAAAAPATDTPAAGDASDGRQLELVDMGAPAGAAQTPAAGAGASLPAQELAAAPAAPAAAQAPAPALAAVSRQPAPVVSPAVGGAAGQPGPLTQALLSIITAKAANGAFTEAEALALINKLMAA